MTDSGEDRDLPDEALTPSTPDQPPPREPIFNVPGVIVFFIAACAGIFLIQEYLLDTQMQITVLRYFAFIPALYSGEYGYDSFMFVAPLSYSLLHGGAAHLIINMVWLAAFGSPLAARIGTWRFVLFWAVTALASVGLYFAAHTASTVPLVGASGAISGMMGAAARFAFRIDRSRGRPAFAGEPLEVGMVLRSRTTVTFLVVWFAVNIVTGIAGLGAPDMTAQIAWEAHIGFITGFFLIGLFDRPEPPQIMPPPAAPGGDPGEA